jgi:hypothetical protein
MTDAKNSNVIMQAFGRMIYRDYGPYAYQKYVNDDYAWDTSCGKCFILSCDTPEAHGMKFCCYCGKPMEVLTHADEQFGVGA